MSEDAKIIVDGDSYGVAYNLASQSVHFAPEAHLFPLIAGAHFIEAAVRFVIRKDSKKYGLSPGDATSVVLASGKGFLRENKICRQFNLETFPRGLHTTKSASLSSCLRAKGGWENLLMPWSVTLAPSATAIRPQQNDVVVHWLGDETLGKRTVNRFSPEPCRYHVQSGTPSWAAPEHLASPSTARLIVTSLGERIIQNRIRKTLSYEAITVDVLRLLRGTKEQPEPQIGNSFGRVFKVIKSDLAPAETCLLFRINSAATLFYRFSHRSEEEAAYLFFRKDRVAPVDIPGLGRMHGYTGFLSAHLAAHAYLHPTEMSIDEWVANAVCKSLLRQAAYFEAGFLRVFFKITRGPKRQMLWKPIQNADWNSRQHWFEELERLCERMIEEKRLYSDPHKVKVDVFSAVSHRTQWFIAQDILAAKNKTRVADDDIEPFRKTAIGWLTGPEKPENQIPVLDIGKLRLIDRREIEDYLAIHQALAHYSVIESLKPLNIAVFGPPGAGKSFGVTQVAEHISSAAEVFAERPLTYNVGQFTTLKDLSAALHRVRDECLRGRIPIVFFDEFDSAFEGRPFGWLKYFLLPMQDGEFADQGYTHKLGQCVLVFAGGINRSFEEMNGRLRNQSFCEAKGPDFISRLRAHLNIRGINKPDDENDHGRYILRRAIILRQKLCEILQAKKNAHPEKLMHENVAAAFCTVTRFKHGVRSMEAILNMCDICPGHALGPSDLPAKAQLEMHVDAAEFLECLTKKSDV